MKEICFVCSANECRSPIAEKIFKTMLKEQKIKNIKVSSRGLDVRVGAKISLKAKQALKNLGYNTFNKKSKQLEIIMPSVVYVTMTKQQKDYIGKKNAIDFASLTGKNKDILDPFNESQEVYDSTAKLIEEYCFVLLSKIKNLIK